MPWNTLANLANGDLVAESHMDAIRENINWLGGMGVKASISDANNRTTTSTTFVNMHASALDLVVTTYGNPVLLLLTGAFSNSGGDSTYGDITVNGTRLGGTNGLGTLLGVVGAGMLLYAHLTLAAGTYTFRPQWRVATNTGNTNGNTTPTRFYVLGG